MCGLRGSNQLRPLYLMRIMPSKGVVKIFLLGDARRALDWEAQFKCAMDPETARAIRNDRSPENEDTCSMCGKFCAVRNMNKALNNEKVDIL